MNRENPYFCELAKNCIEPFSFNDIVPIIQPYLNREDHEIVLTNQIPGRRRKDDDWLTDWGEHWRITRVGGKTLTLQPRTLTGDSDDKREPVQIKREEAIFTGFSIHSLHNYPSAVLSREEKVYWSVWSEKKRKKIGFCEFIIPISLLENNGSGI